MIDSIQVASDAAFVWGGLTKPTIVYATIGRGPDGFQVGEGEWFANKCLPSMLVGFYAPQEIETVLSYTVQLADLQGSDLVLVGGPMTNRIARELVRHLNLKTKLRAEEQDYYLDYGDQSMRMELANDGGFVRDFGLVAKKRYDGRTVIVMAGTRSPGTQGAAAILCMAESLREIVAFCDDGETDEFELIVKIERGEHTSSSRRIQIVEPFVGNIHENPLSINATLAATRLFGPLPQRLLTVDQLAPASKSHVESMLGLIAKYGVSIDNIQQEGPTCSP